MKKDPSMLPVAMRKKTSRSVMQKAALVGGITTAALAASTQTFAWATNYHAALGWSLHGIYPPWSILPWGMNFTELSSLAMASGSVGVTVASSALLVSLPYFFGKDSVGSVLHGSARWGTKKDLKNAALLEEEGVYLGGWEDKNGRLYYLRHNGSEHVLSIAPTRSGKGVCEVIPTLLSWMQSCVVADLKGELWALTAGWRKEYAKNKVLLFEPAAEQGSVGWNPLDEVRLGSEYEIGDVQNLATMIVDPDGKGLNDHWQKTSQALLVGCILHLLYKRVQDPSIEASLSSVDAMLADPSCPTSQLWEEMIKFPHLEDQGVHPAVAKAAQDMIDRPEDEAGSVLSSAKSYLALYRDPVVAANTRWSGFHIKDLMNSMSPVSLYIVTQPADKARLRPLVRLLLTMICRVLADKMVFEKSSNGSRRGKSSNKYKLLMMLDEFPSLGKLEIIQESLAFLAGFGIRFFIVCQDMSQLRSEEFGYGKDESISSNCHIQCAFQPNKLETAEYLSRLTGTTTVINEQQTTSGHRANIFLGNVSKSVQEISRPLMTPDECMRMPPPEKRGDLLIKGGNMLVYVAGFPAFFGRQIPYFQDPVFNARCSVDPPLASDILHENPLFRADNEEVKISLNEEINVEKENKT